MDADVVSLVFAALADPTRRAILERLGEGEATVGELAAPFPISLPAVSRHLKVLERAGLITRGRNAQWRTTALRVDTLQEAAAWMAHLHRLWGHRFDRLDAHLADLRRRSDAGPPSAENHDNSTDPERNRP